MFSPIMEEMEGHEKQKHILAPKVQFFMTDNCHLRNIYVSQLQAINLQATDKKLTNSDLNLMLIYKLTFLSPSLKAKQLPCPKP